MFSHQKSIKKAFFLSDFPQGGLVLPKLTVSCQTFKMVIERCFYFISHFGPFKTHRTGQISCFLIRRVLKKPFFSIWPLPQGILFCQNKSQLSNLQNGHTEMFLINPPFRPFKNHWTCQKSCFLIRRVLKSLFSIWPPPRGSCFAKIRVSCQTFKMVIERCFSYPTHFWPFKSHWTCQKSCFLIRRVL